MKIVQINAVYGVGSTGRIAQDIAATLRKGGHEAYVFWATLCRQDAQRFRKLCQSAYCGYA